MTRDYLQARIEFTMRLIEAYEAAVLALTENGGIEEYLLDTGQSIQRVKRYDLPRLTSLLDILYNRLAMFEARLSGSNVVIGRPC